MVSINNRAAGLIAVVFSVALLFASAAYADTVCTYTISPKSKVFSAKAGSASIRVKTKSGCEWTAVSSDSWLTITSGESGNASGSVKYSASANAVTSSRTATITVAGQTFTVTQAAGAPRVSVTPASVNTGTVEIGAESGAREIKAKNIGTAGLTISSVAISGTNESEFSIESDACSSETLAVGDTCSVSVIFTPESKGKKNAILVFSSDDPARPSLSSKFSGTGKAPVDRSAKYVNQLISLNKLAGQGEVSDEDYLTQLYEVMSAIDNAPNGPQLLEEYLKNKVLGSKFPSAGSIAVKSGLWDDIQNSEAWLVIKTFVSTVTESIAMEFVPGGDALSAASHPELVSGILLINYEAQIRNICYSNPQFLDQCITAKNKVGDDPAAALIELCEATGTPLPSNICTYSISPTGTQVEAAEGGPWGITVTAQSGCNWAAATNTSWITVTDVSSEGILGTSGPGVVSFTVNANTKTSQRAGSIVIAGKLFSVTQKGAESSGTGSPFQGSLTGNWSGTCTEQGYSGSVNGAFSMSISSSGAVTGSYSGDDSGPISGTVSASGSFATGSAGGSGWSGSFSVSGTAMSGSGSWSAPGCTGSWSGTGATTN